MREDPQVSINISREVFSSDFPDDNYPNGVPRHGLASRRNRSIIR